MSEKKSIDKLFKEQFKDFEMQPNDEVWKNIKQKLNKDKRKRRVVPIWWKLAGVAAVLLLLLTAGNFIFKDFSESNLPNSNTVVDSKEDSKAEKEINSSVETTENNSVSDLSPENEVENKSSNSKNNIQNVVADTKSNIDHSGDNDAGTNKITSKISSEEKRENINTAIVESGSNTSETHADEGQDKNPLEKSSLLIDKDKNTEVVAYDQGNLPKKENEEITGSTSQKTVAQTENLSNSKSNKNSENATIDTSDADALISESKRDTDAAVTDNKTAAQLESQIENDSTQNIENKNAIEEAIALLNDTEDVEKEEEEKLNRWSVSPSIAPVYFNSLNKSGSSLDDQFRNNQKEGEVNMSYGVAGSYAINKKLKIRAGVNRVELGYRTNDVFVFDNANAVIPSASLAAQSPVSQQQFSNINIDASHAQNSYLSAANISRSSAPELLFNKEQISLDQSLGFIEVPIELEYNLIETKFGLNLIGGFSTFFLNNNDLFAIENGNSTYFGEATNVNDMSYSANFGLGLNYYFTKQLRFNLEPTFKYQINTFNNTSGDFNPYFIGLYTGLSFKF